MKDTFVLSRNISVDERNLEKVSTSSTNEEGKLALDRGKLSPVHSFLVLRSCLPIPVD